MSSAWWRVWWLSGVCAVLCVYVSSVGVAAGAPRLHVPEVSVE